MTHTMKVNIQCPKCDEGVLIATVDPDTILELEDEGCGHAESLYPYTRALYDDIWGAVAQKEYDAYLDAQDSRFSAWRDR